MRRQRQRRIEMVGDHHRGQEDAVVEERGGRNIAAARRHQLQQRHRRRAAAVGQRRDRMAAKAFAKMFLRAVAVAIVGEHGAEALMRRRVIWIGF